MPVAAVWASVATSRAWSVCPAWARAVAIPVQRRGPLEGIGDAGRDFAGLVGVSGLGEGGGDPGQRLAPLEGVGDAGRDLAGLVGVSGLGEGGGDPGQRLGLLGGVGDGGRDLAGLVGVSGLGEGGGDPGQRLGLLEGSGMLAATSRAWSVSPASVRAVAIPVSASACWEGSGMLAATSRAWSAWPAWARDTRPPRVATLARSRSVSGLAPRRGFALRGGPTRPEAIAARCRCGWRGGRARSRVALPSSSPVALRRR